MAVVKTECEISQKKFLKHAKPITIDIPEMMGPDGPIPARKVVVAPRAFSPKKAGEAGSFGWFFNDKVSLAVDGIAIKATFQVMSVVVGSKDAPKDDDQGE